jgi:hypothetical protein
MRGLENRVAGVARDLGMTSPLVGREPYASKPITGA